MTDLKMSEKKTTNSLSTLLKNTLSFLQNPELTPIFIPQNSKPRRWDFSTEKQHQKYSPVKTETL